MLVQRFTILLNFWCLLSQCLDPERSLSLHAGCTLVGGEHLVCFLSGVPITLDNSLPLQVELASSPVHRGGWDTSPSSQYLAT